jgi:plasmid stabilization system protein ParE
MELKIRIHPKAEAEFKDSIIWYKNQQKGLEQEFVRCIDEAIEKIKRNPELYPLAHKNFRKIIVRRFPFVVIYEFDETSIRILAIFHSRRNPKIFKSRI